MGPNHKNGETKSRPQKWAGLGGGQSWVFWRFGCQREVQRKIFCYKIFEKFKKDEYNHGMYFLEI